MDKTSKWFEDNHRWYSGIGVRNEEGIGTYSGDKEESAFIIRLRYSYWLLYKLHLRYKIIGCCEKLGIMEVS